MKLRAEPEWSKKKNRALKRQSDSSFEEIEQLDTELESVTRDYSSKLEKLAQAEHDKQKEINELKLEKQRLQEQCRYFRTHCDKKNTALKNLKIDLKKRGLILS